MANKYTLDTSTIITRKVAALPKNFLVSGVVLAELIASANDDNARKVYEAIRNRHLENGSLIVPTSEDWLMASRVLFWLTRRRKKAAGGQSPPQQTGAAQRMMMDALIAVSARRVGAPDGKDLIAAYGGKIHRLNLADGKDTVIPFTAKVSLDVTPKLDFPIKLEQGAVRARIAQQPVLSPDGKRLAFTAFAELYLMELSGGQPRRATSADAAGAAKILERFSIECTVG